MALVDRLLIKAGEAQLAPDLGQTYEQCAAHRAVVAEYKRDLRDFLAVNL